MMTLLRRNIDSLQLRFGGRNGICPIVMRLLCVSTRDWDSKSMSAFSFPGLVSLTRSDGTAEILRTYRRTSFTTMRERRAFCVRSDILFLSVFCGKLWSPADSERFD